MPENEKISIIVPAYNNAPWLPRCLDSLLAQTYRNLEIIVVDDGSSDDTMELLKQYQAQDSRIIPIHQENEGVTSARLRGVQEASGSWIGFVDGDDWVEPQMFGRLWENAGSHHADLSHCGVQRNFPDGRIDYYYNTASVQEYSNIQGLNALLLGQQIEPGLVCKLFRRALFDGLADWMDRSIRINEDLLMNYYLFRQAERSVFEDVCPYHYMMRKGSASSAHWNEHKLNDPLRVTKIMMADHPPAISELLFQKYIRQLVYGAVLTPADQPELILPYRAKVRQELRQNLRKALSSPLGVKLKLMALWASVWPASYALIHQIYARLSGIDRKYSV